MDRSFPCQKADAATVAKKLLENVFPLWGTPGKISSVQRTHVTEQDIKQFNRVIQTLWHYHCPCHLQSSGKGEHTNGILKLKLAKLTENTVLSWPKMLLLPPYDFKVNTFWETCTDTA